MNKLGMLGTMVFGSSAAMAGYTCSTQCYFGYTTAYVGQFTAYNDTAEAAMRDLVSQCSGEDKILVHKLSFEQTGDSSTRRIASLEAATPVNSCIKDEK